MNRIKKLIVTLLVAVLCVSAIMVPAMAATVSENGLEATLTTDKEVYTQGEQITATLVVKNVSEETLKNVSLKTSIPKGYVVSSDSKNKTQVEELKAGESVTLTVVYEGEPLAVTGDQSVLMIGMAVMVVAAMGLVVVMTLKQKNMKAVLSIALCVVMVGAVICTPVYAAENDPVTVETTVKVAEKDVIITGTVTYGEDVEVLPEDIQVTNGGFETGDLTGWTVLTEGWGEVDGKPTGVISAATYWGEELPYNQGGEYHLDGWNVQDTSNGAITEASAWSVRSEKFTLAGSGFISVKMGGNAAAVKVYKADGTQIGYYKQTRFNDANFPHVGQGGSWGDMGTYVIDLSNYVGEKLYIELCDEGEGAWAVAFFDDVVTYYETAPDYKNMADTVLDGHTADETPAEIKIAWTLATNAL